MIFEKNSLIHAINIYFQMFYLALTSCLFTLALGFVAHESHAHAHLPGFCNNLDCPRFSVLQTFKVNKCIIYISHNQWLIFRSCRIALISLFFGESIRNWYFPCLISQNAYFVFCFIEGRVWTPTVRVLQVGDDKPNSHDIHRRWW